LANVFYGVDKKWRARRTEYKPRQQGIFGDYYVRYGDRETGDPEKTGLESEGICNGTEVTEAKKATKLLQKLTVRVCYVNDCKVGGIWNCESTSRSFFYRTALIKRLMGG
jgi:hypothetical protein